MNLPTLDYTSEEALQSSADSRAAVALQVADSPVHFNGMELRLTVSIKSLFFMLQKPDGGAEAADERRSRDSIILLYLASQPSSAWSAPTVIGKQYFPPLRSRPSEWLQAIDEWADENIKPADLAKACDAVDELWDLHHATRPALDDEPETALGNGQLPQLGSSA